MGDERNEFSILLRGPNYVGPFISSKEKQRRFFFRAKKTVYSEFGFSEPHLKGFLGSRDVIRLFVLRLWVG